MWVFIDALLVGLNFGLWKRNVNAGAFAGMIIMALNEIVRGVV